MTKRQEYIKANMDFYDDLDEVIVAFTTLCKAAKFKRLYETNDLCYDFLTNNDLVWSSCLTSYEYKLGKLAWSANKLSDELYYWSINGILGKPPVSLKVIKRRRYMSKALHEYLRKREIEESGFYIACS